jgi:hypothetical protein
MFPFNPKDPCIVFYIPSEKWMLRNPDGTWDVTNRVGRIGAEMYLASIGWPPAMAKMFLKSAELQVLVYGAEMCPGQPIICEDAEGRAVVNLWRPPTLVPKPGTFPTIDRVLNHMTAGDAAGRKWLETWLAYKIQNPDAVPKVAVIFATSQGAGKGFLARVVAEILGPANCAVVKQQELGNKFNKRWIRSLFVLGDEVISNENIRDISQLLKILVDGGELELEGKYENQTSVRSRLAWMFASNDRISPLALEDSDRRYTFFSNFDPVSPEYTTAMNACFEADRVTLTEEFKTEIAAFADYLLKLPVDAVYVTKPYKNADRADLIEANLQSHELFIREIADQGLEPLLEAAKIRDASLVALDEAEWNFGEAGIATGVLYKVYRTFCKDSGQHPLRINKFGAALKRHQWVKTRNTIRGTRRQVWCYVVPRNPAAPEPDDSKAPA